MATRIMRVAGSDQVRICGERSARDSSVRTSEDLFELLSERVALEFLEAALDDIDDFIRNPETASSYRTDECLERTLEDDDDAHQRGES